MLHIKTLWLVAGLTLAAIANSQQIDIFELLGNDPTLAFLTYHFEGIPFSDPNRQTQLVAVNNNDFSKDWYTFGVDWRPGEIVWYINGVEQFRTTDRVPDEAMNLLLTFGE